MVVSPSSLVDQIFTPLLGEILNGTQLHIEPPNEVILPEVQYGIENVNVYCILCMLH